MGVQNSKKHVDGEFPGKSHHIRWKMQIGARADILDAHKFSKLNSKRKKNLCEVMPAGSASSSNGGKRVASANKKNSNSGPKASVAATPVVKKLKGNATDEIPVKVPEDEIGNCWCDRTLSQRLAKAGFYYLNCPNRAFNPETKGFDGGCNVYCRSEDVVDGTLVLCGECNQYHKATDDKCKNCARIAWDSKPEVAALKSLLRLCYCDRDLAVYMTKNKEPNFYYYKCAQTKKDANGNWVTGCNFWTRCDKYDSLPQCEVCLKLVCSYKCQQCPGVVQPS